MLYYIEKNNKIVLFNEDKKVLKNGLELMPQYKNLEIQQTEKNIVNYNGEFVFEDSIQDKLIKDRKAKFNKEFFNTSLGWIRRSVTMANGSTKDFISDLLPVISMAVSSGKPVTVLAYNKPDFTKETIDWVQYQHKETVTPEFIQECFLQLSNDFLPEMI